MLKRNIGVSVQAGSLIAHGSDVNCDLHWWARVPNVQAGEMPCALCAFASRVGRMQHRLIAAQETGRADVLAGAGKGCGSRVGHGHMHRAAAMAAMDASMFMTSHAALLPAQHGMTFLAALRLPS